jgi:hypothetical protein
MALRSLSQWRWARGLLVYVALSAPAAGQVQGPGPYFGGVHRPGPCGFAAVRPSRHPADGLRAPGRGPRPPYGPPVAAGARAGRVTVGRHRPVAAHHVTAAPPQANPPRVRGVGASGRSDPRPGAGGRALGAGRVQGHAPGLRPDDDPNSDCDGCPVPPATSFPGLGLFGATPPAVGPPIGDPPGFLGPTPPSTREAPFPDPGPPIGDPPDGDPGWQSDGGVDRSLRSGSLATSFPGVFQSGPTPPSTHPVPFPDPPAGKAPPSPRFRPHRPLRRLCDTAIP